MTRLYGEYDVIVVGAGVTGIVASVAAAREGASVLLAEGSGMLGGLITGGRLSKPSGYVQPGVYRELIERCADYGGADPNIQESYWGTYSGVFDTETMQRVIIEVIDDAGVEVLLYAQTTDVLDAGGAVRGVELATKSGRQVALARTVIDTTGDGDVAAQAGAEWMYGRPGDGLVQPMTSYFRILNVDMAKFARDCEAHPEDVRELVLPDGPRETNKDFALKFFMTGLTRRIAEAQAEGFDWIVPKDHITLKSGLLPGEINVNSTRVQGNALEPRERTGAALQVRRQAYCTFDFLRRYVDGFADAIFLDVAPVLGVRETRRITGDYVLTEDDVSAERVFDDSIGLTNSPIDIHEPGGPGGVMIGVGRGYTIPYRCLLPRGVDNVLVAGRCLSADHVAFGSTRNTPVCAITGQAAGVAAALAASAGVPVRDLQVSQLQDNLRRAGMDLGLTAVSTS